MSGRFVRRVVAGTVLVAAAIVAAVALARADEVPARSSSVQDSPGWTPPADPESASIRLGRRSTAPRVRLPFQGGGTSLEDLGRRICRVFERTPALDSLLALAVSEEEFRVVLWPEFPESRPATGLLAADAWGVLAARLANGCNSALLDWGGRPVDLLRVEVARVAPYRNFRLHQGVTLVVRDAAGTEHRLSWVRAIAERGGRFKLYSVRD